ncbi:type II secretion system F family protein [Kitasatospora sp. NPDC002551]|uniref:type II secretion system F family protein n=1 Tax=Kitasatospora sp. NPDC002551 TaxID=3154539 RepID=UPI00331876AE
MNLSPTALLAAVCGTVAVLGLALAVYGAVGASGPAPARPPGRLQRRAREATTALRGRGRLLIAAAGAVGLLVWLLTSWLLGGLLTAAAILGMPWILQPGRGGKDRIERLEALEEWVRRLADIHTAGISLEQAVTSSVRSAPERIAPEISRLASRLATRWRPQDAYRQFADDLDDATADSVAALMIGHVHDRGAGLSTALKVLAGQLSEEVLMRRKIEADREKPRANMRWVSLFCLAVFGVSVVSGGYVAPYSTPFGHLLLLLLATAFAATLVWMRRMALSKPTPRFLSGPDTTSQEGT